LIFAALLAHPPVAPEASAQSSTACGGRDCATADQLWAGVAQIHQVKNDFVVDLRQFAELAAGYYGDEGSRLSSSLDSMARALAEWDRAIRTYEMTFGTTADNADLHLALGSIYLDRGRAQDGLREFEAAARLAPDRPDVQTSAALAFDAVDDPADAARALRHASAIERNNPTTWYRLAQHLAKIGQQREAEEARRSFQELQQKPLQGGSSTAAVQFERVSLLRQVAGVAPIFPLGLYVQGFRLLTAGQYERAIGSLREAAGKDPLAASPATGQVAQAGQALRQGRLPMALSALTTAVRDAPDDAEAHRLLGIAYWADDQHDRSIEQLSIAVRLNRRDERSLMTLADVFTAAGRSPDAERTLKETIRIIPESGQAYYRLGQLYQGQSLLPPALEALEKAATCSPLVGLDYLYETVGGLYLTQANFDRAVNAYLTRIDVNPNNADAHRKLGEIYFLQGRHDEALAEFTATLLLDPASADAFAASGQVYLRLDRYAEAVNASRRAITLDPGHQKARYTLATALMRLGETEEGKRELDVFQRMVAESTALMQRRSELNDIKRQAVRSMANGDDAGAAALLRTAAAGQPDLAQTHLDLGIALMNAGQYQDALESFKRARGLEDRADVHRYLAETYQALGRTEESQIESALYAQAIERVKEERLRTIGRSR
jgi:tetratricopeptide (TPR) repeat protein